MSGHQTTNSASISKTLNWRCKNCGEYESMTFDIPDILAKYDFPQPRLCTKCERAEIEAANRRTRRDQLETLADQAAIPQTFRRFDAARGNVGLRQRCIDSAAGSMWIYGARGRGKTLAACQAAMDELEIGTASVRFARIVDIASTLTDRERSPYLMRELLAFRVLILDDFAAARVSDALGQRLYALIDAVYNSKTQRRVWITSDVAADAIAARFDDANCAGRIIGRFKRMVSDGRMAVISADGAEWAGSHGKR